ncbi:hypothetical protein B0J17DRAFT_704632 [Rhizoctonia solani]|nr:hypothetical protein B0J17DRAFT_704632 [Rhizoctonia solani]
MDHWEKAGASLANAVDVYLDLCLSLEVNSLKEDMPLQHLVTRIDNAVEFLHTVLDRRIAQARSTLCRTRNRIVSPISCFPEELLMEIFAYVTFTGAVEPAAIDMESRAISIYRSLHNLLGVCSTWRNIALNQGALWSTIPVLESNLPLVCRRATDLSLQRAKNYDLHLAASLLYTPRILDYRNLGENTSRFRTINITTTNHDNITHIMDAFLESGELARLSELSIRVKRDGGLRHQVIANNGDDDGSDRAILYADGQPNSDSFSKVLESLSVFRVSGINLYWGRIAFSSQLVTLHLQDLNLGFDLTMVDLLNRALSSAIRLRDLKLISIRSSHSFTIRFSSAMLKSIPKLSLPNLETLLLDDLCCNTLMILLGSVISRSHRLTLHLTKECLKFKKSRSQAEQASIIDLCSALEHVSVYMLCISSDPEDAPWLSDWEFETLLKSVATAKILKMNHWHLSEDCCRVLGGANSSLSLLELHLSCAIFWDMHMVAFRGAVLDYSQSLRRVVLGGRYCTDPEGKTWAAIREDGVIASWLIENVGSVSVTTEWYKPPEFEQAKWRLW